MCVLHTNKRDSVLSYGIYEIIASVISTLCKFELDAAATMSLQRQKERLRSWQRKTALSYILSHYLPTTKQAASTLNGSPGQTAAKYVKKTSTLLTLLSLQTCSLRTYSHMCKQSRVKFDFSACHFSSYCQY